MGVVNRKTLARRKVAYILQNDGTTAVAGALAGATFRF